MTVQGDSPHFFYPPGLKPEPRWRSIVRFIWPGRASRGPLARALRAWALVVLAAAVAQTGLFGWYVGTVPKPPGFHSTNLATAAAAILVAALALSASGWFKAVALGLVEYALVRQLVPLLYMTSAPIQERVANLAVAAFHAAALLMLARAGFRIAQPYIGLRTWRQLPRLLWPPPAGAPSPVRRFLSGAVLLAGALQMALAVRVPDRLNLPVLALGLVAALAAAHTVRTSRRLPALVLAGSEAALAAGFVIHVWQAPGFPLRLLQAAIALVHVAIVLAATAALVRPGRAKEAMLLASSLAVTMILAEWLLGLVPLGTFVHGAYWEGGTEPHPVLGEYYVPYSEARNFYPANPRNYFTTTDPVRDRWQLSAHAPSAARLELIAGRPDAARVLTTHFEPRALLWEVQLALSPYALRGGREYELSFSARGARERVLGYAITMMHPPWQPVSPYRTDTIGPAWKNITMSFRATSNEPVARIQFDFGGDSTSAEIADPVLLGRPANDTIRPQPQTRYFVRYQFNGLGCRGPDYAVPRPRGTLRILALGDSYTLGVGVHQPDTYEAQLERLLAERDRARPVEVVNCGVSGYATREERLHYELISRAYQPDVVLVSMVMNDDRSWRDDLRLGYFRASTRLERLFLTLAAVQTVLHHRPPPDFNGSVNELKQLNAEARRHGARLAVAVFRNAPLEGDWRSLVTTITRGLRDTGIPLIDLGPAVGRGDDWNQLLVFPGIDGHPNEIAHQRAAKALAGFLDRSGLLNAAPDAAPRP